MPILPSLNKVNAPLPARDLYDQVHADLEARIQRAQLEVGDDDSDLDEFIDGEIQSGHLTVDPYQPVVLARSHAAHPRAGAHGTRGGSR